MGISFELSVLITGAFMLVYVIAGGMLATTWVQIIKAVLLMVGATVLSIFVLVEIGGTPIDLFNDAQAESPDGQATWSPACSSPSRSTPCRSGYVRSETCLGAEVGTGQSLTERGKASREEKSTTPA